MTKLLHIRLITSDFDVSYCNATDVIARLQAYVDEHGESVYLSQEPGAYEGDSDEIHVSWKELETDQEYDSRLKRQASLAQAEEARERETLARLMLKYNKGNEE